MGKLGTGLPGIFVAAILLVLALGHAPAASAQQTGSAQQQVVDTPPELRDFKLEPEKPKSQPLPGPEPSITDDVVRPAQASRSAQPVATTPPRAPANPVLEMPTLTNPGSVKTGLTAPAAIVTSKTPPSPAAKQPVQAEPPSAQSAAEPVPMSSQATNAAMDIISPQDAAASQAKSDQAVTAGQNGQKHIYWQTALTMFVLLLLLAAAYMFITRMRNKPNMESQPEPLKQAAVTPADENGVSAEKTGGRIDEQLLPDFLKTGGAAKQRALLSAIFTPEKATISFANLTIKGYLQITNDGNAPTSLSVRTAIISASADQHAAIEAFHNRQDKETGRDETIAAGETLNIEVDLHTPLRELNIFTVKERKLFAPIILADIRYHQGDDPHPEILRLSYLIGREATPPKPKMGPLRLDLGPRSIVHLGQRPLFG